ncbi:MAG: outer membrane beta-barrel protein, partial [bacterium]|nr:outer membrane beta-barrel protein [bacterium]
VHLKQKSWAEAEKTFQEVVLVDPNSDIAAYANEYMKAIGRRQDADRPWRLQAGFYFEFDDNVVLKPSDVTTVGDIGNEDDTREVVTANAEWAHRFNERLSVRLQYDLYFAQQNSLNAFDLHSHTWGVVPVYQPESQNWTFSVPVQYNHTWVEDDGFLSSGTVNPLVNFKITDKQTGQIGCKFQLKDYLKSAVNDNEDRDAFRAAPGLGWLIFFWDNKALFNARYEFDTEDTDGINWEYVGHRATASVRVPFFVEKLNLTLAGDMYQQDFDNTHTTFNIQREDKAYTASSQLSYDLTQALQLQLRYTFVDHDSNISIYRYDRNVVSGGVLAKF